MTTTPEQRELYAIGRHPLSFTGPLLLLTEAIYPEAMTANKDGYAFVVTHPTAEPDREALDKIVEMLNDIIDARKEQPHE